MAEFTEPTGERAEKILKAARETVAAGQTIEGGAPELAVMKKAADLKDITSAERDWAWEKIKPAEPKGLDIAVHCARCDRQVDRVSMATAAKVYVECHGVRQGVPCDPKSGELIVAFKDDAPAAPESA